MLNDVFFLCLWPHPLICDCGRHKPRQSDDDGEVLTVVPRKQTNARTKLALKRANMIVGIIHARKYSRIHIIKVLEWRLPLFGNSSQELLAYRFTSYKAAVARCDFGICTPCCEYDKVSRTLCSNCFGWASRHYITTMSSLWETDDVNFWSCFFLGFSVTKLEIHIIFSR